MLLNGGGSGDGKISIKVVCLGIFRRSVAIGESQALICAAEDRLFITVAVIGDISAVDSAGSGNRTGESKVLPGRSDCTIESCTAGERGSAIDSGCSVHSDRIGNSIATQRQRLINTAIDGKSGSISHGAAGHVERTASLVYCCDMRLTLTGTLS